MQMCVGWVAQRPSGRLKLFGMERVVEETKELNAAVFNTGNQLWTKLQALLSNLAAINLTD